MLGKDNDMKKVYKVSVDCANCANQMESAIKKLSGVEEAIMNFMTGKLTMVFSENADIDSVMSSVEKTCRKIESDFEILL